ncbi:MAG: endolytic transglycosylase MltG [Candidatus Deferrimicrobiaceae bacterium]
MSARKWSVAAALVLAVSSVSLFLVTARPSSEQWRVTKVHIPKGSTYPEIEKMLIEKRLLRYPVAFRILVVGTMTGAKLQQGEYVFPAPPSAFELWGKIGNGDVAKYQVIIPDGSTIYDIAQTLGNLELANPSTFLATATSPELALRMEIPGSTLEGYLFPDTYTLVKDMSAEEILRVMVRRFQRKFTPEMERKAKEEGLTRNQIVTIASIIEKETGVEAEKPMVSAVIRKRLSLGMPLQMDPTIIYGLKKFGGNLTKKDLKTPNSYNTYLTPGLPPGPICNPGLSALKAAIYPSDTDYLYFVSRNDGSHRFSRTLKEHNEAVMDYKKGKNAKIAPLTGTEGTNEPVEGGLPAPTPPPRPSGPS